MKLRMICILICLSILLSSHVFAAPESATVTETTSEQEMVETIALDYIAQYVFNAYLYEENDLQKGTIREAIDERFIAQTDTVQFNTAEEVVTTATLVNRMESFQLAADYYRHIRTAQDIKRYDFLYTPTVVESSVNGNCATVHIYTYITFKYEQNAEESAFGDNYMVYLLKVQDQWLIADVQAEELIAYGLTDLNETYAERIAEFDEMLAAQRLEKAEVQESIISPQAVPTSCDVTYNVNNAIAYAYTYTTSSYNDIKQGNNSAFLNSVFNDFSEYGNCQNFVSQCLWAGLGGNDEAKSLEYISNQAVQHHFPMNNSWYDTLNDAGHAGSWTGVNDFYAYVTGNNCEMVTTHTFSQDSFGQIPVNDLRGAVLNVNPKDNGGFKHAVLITKAIGRSYGDVEICGNSPMRKAARLSDQRYDSNMRLIIPSAMKRRSACINGTHNFSGGHCKCSYCGFNKLTVTGTMLKPVPVGSTQTISASTNSGCYRIAVCVQHEAAGSTPLWTEYTNTSQVSRSFTFSNTGLYTITIVARDVSPNDANSITSRHVFKVRVY